MSGSMEHSQAEVIRQLLIDLGQGTDPDDGGDWPIYTVREPDTPDDCMTVYNTTGRLQGRVHSDGEVQEFHGFQVRVRCVGHEAGYSKARAVAVDLDQEVAYTAVTVLDTVGTGQASYTVFAVTRTGDVVCLGKETPTSKRELFTINAVVSLRQN